MSVIIGISSRSALYEERSRSRRRRWPPASCSRVLRDGESTIDAVSYVLRNPVRARLAAKIGDYELAGSDVFSRQELDEVLGVM